jgi:uncharacterized protein DUF3592
VRYWTCVLLAFASVIGAFMLGAWSIHEIVQIGTCASGGPYVSARPCPKGTEFKILAVFGAVGLLLAGMAVWSARGREGRSPISFSTTVWSLGWLVLDGTMLVAAFGPGATGEGGWKTAAVINAAVGLPLAVAPLVGGVFMRGKRAQAADLIAHGRSAPGRVTDIHDTGITINNNPRVKVSVRAEPPGEPAFDVQKTFTASRVELPRVGDVCTVFYDPLDRSKTGITFDPVPGVTPPAAPTRTPSAAPPADTTPENVAERLKELDELRAKGAITDAERDAQRARILGEL